MYLPLWFTWLAVAKYEEHISSVEHCTLNECNFGNDSWENQPLTA